MTAYVNTRCVSTRYPSKSGVTTMLGLCVAGRYPYDNVTGFRLDKSCAFECPHRHFSHLLQMYDLRHIIILIGTLD
jgi:hypothetical protein